MEVKTLLITQARLGSSRLPGKVLMEIDGTPILQIHIERLKRSRLISDIVVATTAEVNDEIIYMNALSWGVKAFRGSESDVLDRYYQASKEHNPNWVIRVTSDCPLIDSKLLDDVIRFVLESNVDYGANNLLEHYPDGQDIEVFTFAALEKAWLKADKSFEREHVTPYIRTNSTFKGGDLFRSVNYPCESDYSKIRMTVDEQRDFEVISHLVKNLGIERSWLDYTNYMIENNLNSINGDIIRNSGFLKSVNNING